MNIFKRIWAWLVGTKKQDKEACARNFEKEYEELYLKAIKEQYTNRGKEGIYTELKQQQDKTITELNKYAKDFNRESVVVGAHRISKQEHRRNSDDTFALGAVVGYVVSDSGSYSSSSDSSSSSFSCDSGGC